MFPAPVFLNGPKGGVVLNFSPGDVVLALGGKKKKSITLLALK